MSTSEPPAEPVVFQSSLPGDAVESIEQRNSSQAPVADSSSSITEAIAPPAQPSVTSGQDAPVVTLRSVSSDGQRSREFHAKYWKPVEHDQPLRQALDLPDAYFQPTASELQAAFAGQVKKREQLTDAPLLTQKLRERQEAEKNRAKAARWPHTRIRIRFADRSQLEGVFPSSDKLVHIYEFARLAIADEHRAKPFVLYQSPPRREYLKTDPQFKGKSLMDLQLTPSSVFYIKFSDDTLNASGVRPPLIPELLGAAADLPLPNPIDQTQADKSASNPPSKMQKLPFGGTAGKVTPNWLRIGKSGSEFPGDPKIFVHRVI